MVVSKKSKIFFFIIFLLPALLLYSLFFIKPFIEGIHYSFTDWNGIVPEIPLSFEKTEFETEVLAKMKSPKHLAVVKKYYRLDGDFYRLTNWISEAGKPDRQLTNTERQKIKKALKTVGISSINYIGFENYKQMFTNDIRFIPRFEKRFLYNEFEDLPETIEAKAFHKYLLNNIKDPADKKWLLTKYQFDATAKSYHLLPYTEAEDERLRTILAQNMFENKFIPGVIGFTLFFTFFNVVITNLFALLLAMILDTKLRFKNALRSIFFLPNVLSLVIVAFIWSFVFRLILPPLTGIPIWLGNPDIAPIAVLIVSIWQGAGYLMVIYLAGLQTIPAEITEVAEVDGANWFQRFLHVKVPLLVPAFTICFFYSIANSLKMFDLIFALTNGGGPAYATTSIVIDIYNNAFLQNQFGYATAKAIFLCLIIIVITGTQLFLMKRREVEL